MGIRPTLVDYHRHRALEKRYDELASISADRAMEIAHLESCQRKLQAKLDKATEALRDVAQQKCADQTAYLMGDTDYDNCLDAQRGRDHGLVHPCLSCRARAALQEIEKEKP